MDIKNKPTIVDVRTPDEYRCGHIDGAINIPMENTLERIQEFQNMPKPVIAYCRAGNRSAVVVEILKQNGIHDALNGGGMTELKKKLCARML